MKKMQRMLRIISTTAVAGSLCMVFASAATIGAGTVTDNGLRLRLEPNTSSQILDSASKNESIIVLERAEDDWYKVSYDAQIGFMSGEFLKIDTVADVSLGHGKVDTDGSVLRLRVAPSTNDDIICTIPDQTVLALKGVNSGWYKVVYDGKPGYVSSDYMQPVTSSAVQSQTNNGSSTAAASNSSNSNTATGSKIIAYAKQFLGCKYVYGGSSPSGFDCSGFTQYVMRKFGYSINRTASTQLKNGTAVSRSDLHTGDLIFFRQPGSSYAATHVGIYIGNNQFIHASTNDYTVRIDSLNSSWYSKIFTGARRIAS